MKLRSFLIFFIVCLLENLAFSQWRPGRVDAPGPEAPEYERPIPGGSHIDWEKPDDQNNEKVGRPGWDNKNGNRVPAPSPVDDRPGGNSNNSSEYSKNVNSGSSDNQNHLSPSDSKNDQHYDDITRSGPGGGTDNGISSQSTNPHDRSNSNDTRPSSNYTQLVTKGAEARNISRNEKNTSQNDLDGKQSVIIIVIEGSGSSALDEIYSNDINLISNSEKLKAIDLMSRIATYNQNNLFESNPQNLLNPNNKYEEIRQKFFKSELQKMFPGVVNRSLAAVSQAKKMIQNWKLIDNVIDDSLFGKEFIESTSAIQNIQNSINLNGLPAGMSKLLNLIEQAKSKNLIRFYDYILNATVGLHSTDGSPDEINTAANYLGYALNAVSSGNYSSAAADLLTVKSTMKNTTAPYESAIGPDDLFLLGIGPVESVVRGIEKYSLATMVSEATSIERRNVIRALISINDRLVVDTPGKVTVIGHGPYFTNLGVVLQANYLDVPDAIWTVMKDQERKFVNQRFLDAAIARNDKFRLATKAELAVRNSMFEWELEYLSKKGYKVSKDGFWLVKSGK